MPFARFCLAAIGLETVPVFYLPGSRNPARKCLRTDDPGAFTCTPISLSKDGGEDKYSLPENAAVGI